MNDVYGQFHDLLQLPKYCYARCFVITSVIALYTQQTMQKHNSPREHTGCGIAHTILRQVNLVQVPSKGPIYYRPGPRGDEAIHASQIISPLHPHICSVIPSSSEYSSSSPLSTKRLLWSRVTSIFLWLPFNTKKLNQKSMNKSRWKDGMIIRTSAVTKRIWTDADQLHYKGHINTVIQS